MNTNIAYNCIFVNYIRLSDFDYNLPKELIAQEPASPRDHSRMMVVRVEKEAKRIRSRGDRIRLASLPLPIAHKRFFDIVDYLRTGDVLVLNNSKVFPARLIGRRAETGGKVEVFLLRRYGDNKDREVAMPDKDVAIQGLYDGTGEIWQCLVGGPRRKAGLTVEFDLDLKGEIIGDNGDGTWNVRFDKTEKAFMKIVGKIGRMPLPPYIKRVESRKLKAESGDKNPDYADYQTVYADEAKIGSVAAPTAGLHFTPALMKKLKARGVQIEYITLHVGLGTFVPVKADDITQHKMHAEYVEVDKNVIARIAQAKQEGRRVIAVGTTSVRTLEAVFQYANNEARMTNDNLRILKKIRHSTFAIRNFSSWVDIFIYPGYKFSVVDAMITNFHLPKSTLLMLVSAFAGKKAIDDAYREAIKGKYRFYSYGDAMYIES